MDSKETSLQWAKDAGGEVKTAILHDMLTTVADEYSDSLGLVCLQYPPDIYMLPNEQPPNSEYLRWTYRKLQRASHAIAAGLYQKGIRPGMTVAIFPLIGAEFQMIARATWELGCILASLDPATISNPGEVQHMLRHTSPSVILVPTAELAEKIQQNASEFTQKALVKLITNHKEITIPQNWSSFEQLFDFGCQHLDVELPSIDRNLDDEILIIFTSGTTSLPKVCVHTNASISSASYNRCYLVDIKESHVISAHSPLFHAIGILLAIFFSVNGATIVHSAPRFSAGPILEAIDKERITHMTIVPAMLPLLTDNPKLKDVDTSCIERVQLGGSNVLAKHLRDTVNILKADKATSGYGMSEYWNPVYYCERKLPAISKDPVGVGYVVRGSRIKICDPETDQVVKRGEVGELHMGGTGLLKRYLGVDKQLFYEDEDGRWLRSGDQAMMGEDGNVSIVGRYKELIIRGGHNIAPAAVENVFSQYAGVQSAVVGIKDEVAGEVPVAVIKGKNMTEDDMNRIRRIATENLGPAYAPDFIIRLEELRLNDYPKTSSNKIRKVELVPMVQEYIEARDRQNSTTDTGLEDTILGLWRRVLNYGKLTSKTRISDMADSLSMSRFRSQLRREKALELTLEEILEHNTVEQQIRLLESRSGSSAGNDIEDLLTCREGPPRAEDMVHTHGDEEKTAATKKKFEDLLKPMGLSWVDVEDVYPMPDLMKVWAHPLRKQSNNHRHAFVTTSKDITKVRAAIEKTLSMHATMRTMGVVFDEDTTLYASIRPTEKFFSHCITVLDEPIKTADDIKALLVHDETYDFAMFPGPLNRYVLVRIEDTQKVGFLYLGQHSSFDALSAIPFHDDLDKALSGQKLRPFVPFKTWADQWYANKDCLIARQNVAYHVRRLSGIAKAEEALFPRQRAAEWFKGHHFGWTPDNDSKDSIDMRLAQQNHIGVEGIAKVARAADLKVLKQTQDIEPAIVVKAALALANMQETGAREALFGAYQAGREWCFTPDWMTKRLPSAMDIDGPTLQVAIERIGVHPLDTVLSLLKRLSAEQTQLTKHAHTPYYALRSALSEADSETLESVRRRQIFNWLPRSQGHRENLQRIQIWSRTDVGLLWNCMALGDGEVRVHASWDDAQLTGNEIEGLLDRVVGLIEGLAGRENWERSLRDVGGM